MKKILDDHLRCEVCDFSAKAPSIFNDSLAIQKPINVAIRGGKAICNVCYGTTQKLSEENNDTLLTGAIPYDKIVYDAVKVKVYPAVHPKLTYYETHGIYQTSEEKEQWRSDYRASLIEGCVPFRGTDDGS